MRGKREQGSTSTPFFESKRQVPVLLVVLIAMAIAVTWGISTKGLPSASGDPGRSPHHVVKVADVDPEAKGVNEGDKEQAAGVRMHSIPKTDAKKLAGKFGPNGGCQPGYGRGKQCLPPVSPAAVAMKMTAAEHPWDCGEVVKLFPKGIKVNKKAGDPLRLDYNKDGVACGVGD